ncbi:MAG: HlyD family efflux transporter periplasmic adaptor subunit [Alkaliphilus sp.]
MKKKKAKNKRYFLKVLVFSIIVLFFLMKIYPLIGVSSKTTYNVEFGKIENIITTTGFVVRDEKVIYNLDKKEVVRYFEDGEKVASGQKLAAVNSNGVIKSIYSEESGLAVFNSDGLEKTFNIDSLDEISFENIALIRKVIDEDKGETLENLEAIKLVTNHVWSIVLILTDEESEKIEVNAKVYLRPQKGNSIYNATVRRILSNDGENVVVLDLSDAVDGFYKSRVILIDIFLNSYKGLMIENTSIVRLNGQKGVFRTNYSGNTEFVPVKIKGFNDVYSIVYDDFFTITSVSEEGETIRVNTIDLFDRILLRGDKKMDEEREE